MTSFWTYWAWLLFPFLPTCASAETSIAYPPDPVAPVLVRECSDLRRQYEVIEQSLERQFSSALGWGRGPQVSAGPCCERTATRGWCRIFQSHAAVWEAIHCVHEAKQAAVDRCAQRVRANRAKIGGPIDDAMNAVVKVQALTDPESLQKARDIIKYVRWADLAKRWTGVGHDSSRLSGLMHETSQEVATKALRTKDEVVRTIVNDNLRDIGVLHSDVAAVFDRTIARIEREFPAATRGGGPASGAPFATPNRPSGQACREAVNEKIAACMSKAVNDPSRALNNFSFYERCSRQFKSELDQCD